MPTSGEMISVFKVCCCSWLIKWANLSAEVGPRLLAFDPLGSVDYIYELSGSRSSSYWEAFSLMEMDEMEFLRTSWICLDLLVPRSLFTSELLSLMCPRLGLYDSVTEASSMSRTCPSGPLCNVFVVYGWPWWKFIILKNLL